MHKSVPRQAKRVLVVGSVDDDAAVSPDQVLAPDGMLIVIEADADRAARMRSCLPRDGLATRTVIGGEPGRILYKLAGPFDVIFCNPAYLSLRPTLEQLLATDGVLITNGEF